MIDSTLQPITRGETGIPIPKRFEIARRYERYAIYPMIVGMSGIAAGAILQNVWILIASPFLGMPSGWLFNIKCYRCAWLVYRVYGTARGWVARDQLFAPLYSRQLWRQPPACTKCGAPFRDAVDA